MKYALLPLDHKLGTGSLAVANSRRSPFIMERIGAYQYDGKRLDQGEGLINHIKELNIRWNKAQVEKKLATQALYALWEEVKGQYIQTRQVARMVFKNNAPQQRVLCLEGRSKRSLPQWLEEARQFYTNALADPEVPKKLSLFGVTAKRLKQEKALLAKVEKAMAYQEKKAGEAMQVTRERKQAVKELDQWMANFFTILRMALGKSQWLTAVGLN
jgi:hypothetical protein